MENDRHMPKPRATRRMAREPGSENHKVDTAPPRAASGASKISQVVALLRRDEGATLKDLTQATGWLPHSARAALTGLKKKGHAIEKDKRDGAACYRIVEAG